MITMTLASYTALVVMLTFFATAGVISFVFAVAWRDQLINTQRALDDWKSTAQRLEASQAARS